MFREKMHNKDKSMWKEKKRMGHLESLFKFQIQKFSSLSLNYKVQSTNNQRKKQNKTKHQNGEPFSNPNLPISSSHILHYKSLHQRKYNLHWSTHN